MSNELEEVRDRAEALLMFTAAFLAVGYSFTRIVIPIFGWYGLVFGWALFIIGIVMVLYILWPFLMLIISEVLLIVMPSKDERLMREHKRHPFEW